MFFLFWRTVVEAQLQQQQQRQLQRQLKYNDVRQKASHNSYERREGLFDQLAYHACRSVEIDCHTSSVPGKFGVYHDAGYFQTYSSLSSLEDAARVLREFHDAVPNHHVITVWVDLKGDLDGTAHTPQDFDDTVSAVLPLWTPADALSSSGGGNNSTTATTLQGAIRSNGWPLLEDLRGRFIWIVTSGQDSYCRTDGQCNAAKAFVASDSVSAEEGASLLFAFLCVLFLACVHATCAR
jgi:hypothetical protein